MLIEAIEKLLNRGMTQSPRARELCAELGDRRIAIDVRGIARVIVACRDEAVRLELSPDLPVDAELRGGPIALLGVVGAEPEEAIRRGDVVLDGDSEVAQKYRELVLLLRPDLEEDLAQLIGDAPAHGLGRLARFAAEWGRRAADTAVRNVAEYLAHERADLVPRAEADQFLRGVDALREVVDRLEARIQRLEQRE